jgi:hypothetical protein
LNPAHLDLVDVVSKLMLAADEYAALEALAALVDALLHKKFLVRIDCQLELLACVPCCHRLELILSV